MTLRRNTVWFAVVAVVVVAITVVLPVLARRLAFFRVRQVEVVGIRYLDESDVVRQLRLRADASTLDRLGRVRKAAAAIPGVLAATVERRLPGTLRVTLREAVPVALVPMTDRLALVDSRGHALPFDPARLPASLPIAGRDSATAGLLGRLLLTDPVWYDSIESARLDRGDIVLDAGPHRVRLRPEADADVLRAVTEVRNYLTEYGISWREIDARYQARVFVRKGAT
jgi:cell division protein FtsQ